MNAEGQLELKRDVMNVPVDKANDTQAASAGRRQLLKESLRQSISAKRAVDRIKKLENHETENKTQESGRESMIESFPLNFTNSSVYIYNFAHYR